MTATLTDARGAILSRAVGSADLGQRTAAPDLSDPCRVSGLRVYVEAETVRGLADGATVTQWPDRSGAGFSFGTSSSGVLPVLKQGQTPRFGPALRWNGSSTIAGLSGSGLGVLQSLSGVTLMAVVRPAALSGTQDLFCSDFAVDGGRQLSVVWSGTAWQVRVRRLNTDGVTTVAGGTALVNARWYLVTAVVNYAAARVELYLNGALDGSGAAGFAAGQSASGASSDVQLGNRDSLAEFAAMDMAAFLLYARPLGSGERRTVERALGVRYGLTIGG